MTSSHASEEGQALERPAPDAPDLPDNPSPEGAPPPMAQNPEILSARLGPFGKLDTAIFRVEMALVVFAMAAMSGTVFVDVLYQFVVSLENAGQGGQWPWGRILGVMCFMGLMGYAAGSSWRPARSPEDTGPEDESAADRPAPLALRLGLASAAMLASAGLGALMLHTDSATVYRVLLALLAAAIVRHCQKAQQPRQAMVTAALGGVGLWAAGHLPEGYSWSQSYGLFLLLWVGFLGASIAARQRRHLSIDLARKLLPARLLPHFNALSYLAAALFTGTVLYLGLIYMFGHDSSYMRPIWEVPTWVPEGLRAELGVFPVPEDASWLRRIAQVVLGPTEPGEIPDWLKVLAIPVSMGLIFVRFLGHTAAFAIMALRGEAFHEQTGGH